MEDVTVVKNYAGLMVDHKKNLENLDNSIKALERQVDSSLQKTVMKSADFIKINSKLKEINIAIKLLQKAFTNKNQEQCLNLLKLVSRKVAQIQNIVVKSTQKTLLLAVEAMAEAEGNLLILEDFTKLSKIIDKIKKDWC